MPVIYVNTNIAEKDIPAGFDLQLCEKVAAVLNKPMERITLTMHTGLRQMRAGSAAPMVCVDIHSIGVFDEQKNPSYTPPLFEFLIEKLRLPADRVVLVYHDLPAFNVGLPPK